MFEKNIGLSPKVVALDGPFQHQHLHTRGVRLHAAVAGDPTRPLVVLLHDAFGGWFDFREVIAPLAAAGYHVAAIDMRGYGMSDKPPSGYDLRHATGDIAGCIRTLGHERAHLVGVGSGAAIAWLMGSSHPNHVASVTGVGAIHPSDMRRAIVLKPWLSTHITLWTALCRMPPSLRTLWWRRRKRVLTRDLKNVTSIEFQRSPEFDETLQLRLRAASIEHTMPAIAKTMRYQVNLPPVRWAKAKLQVPAHMLIDDTDFAWWLARCAQGRTNSGVTTSSVPGSRWRPHIEQPAAFAQEIARVLANWQRTPE